MKDEKVLMDRVIDLINNKRTPQTIPDKMVLILHRLGMGRNQIEAAVTFLIAKLDEAYPAPIPSPRKMPEPLDELMDSLNVTLGHISKLSVIEAMPLGLSGVGVLYNTCFNFRNRLIAHKGSHDS